MEVDGQAIEQGLGGLLEAFEVVPPAMAGEFVFEVTPQALNQVELGRLKWRNTALG
jgi:hypothetical protein